MSHVAPISAYEHFSERSWRDERRGVPGYARKPTESKLQKKIRLGKSDFSVWPQFGKLATKSSGNKNEKKGCNTGTSQKVTHSSTTPAQARLTAEFRWDPVL